LINSATSSLFLTFASVSVAVVFDGGEIATSVEVDDFADAMSLAFEFA
jgi:hypothetical protein